MCLSACLSTVCVCVCVCVCVSGGPVGSAGGCEAGGQGSSDPPASPFTGRGALEGFDDAGSDGEAATPRTQGGETQGGETHTSMS